MTTHLVVGAGPVGAALAHRLSQAGRTVRVVTRSGSGPDLPRVQRLALDATDAPALAAAARGVGVVYNCANPGPYPEWERGWPPLAKSVLQAAEASGAVLVSLGNLYGYGPVDGPMTRHRPLAPSGILGEVRAQVWQDALAAHQAGRVRVTEARASDYIGPTVPASHGLLPRYAASTLAGKTAAVVADPDQPHTWTAVDDVVSTLIALGADDRAWGSPWLVPSNPPASVREVLRELGSRAGTGEPRLRQVPRVALRAGGLAMPLVREALGVLYQFDRPFVADAAETSSVLGVRPTPWRSVLDTTAPAWRARAKP
ncbi:NAD-dependent epimerase/dehydratase family protein [Promicromonospora iranensis]|uniref:Nucleoside-diphosphate-sugar epimerase n=1 Tax=Promicromonospora iranensis TaxID=1105144 RepID=A0ABU2CHG5_9MICO|nr:NAD-dependent epimerase/dehydratase family protein [Promicromonospora iranensis]MDR7380778.1 nucleoside-diphosphate-sugar epimerase [Promicromonospora iranensis]